MSEIKISVHDSIQQLELQEELESLKKSYNAVWKLFEQGELKLEVIFRHLFPETPPDKEPYINEQWDRMVKKIDSLIASEEK